MPEFEWSSPAKTGRMVETEVVRITDSTCDRAPVICSGTGEGGMIFEWTLSPGHDSRNPSLTLYQVRRNPLRALDALEEAAIDGRCAKCGCRSEEERKRDENISVGSERQSGELAALVIALAVTNLLGVWV